MEIKGTSRQHRLVSNSKRKRCSSLSFSFKRCWIRVGCFHLLGKSRLTSPSSWFPSCYIRSIFAYSVNAGYSFKLWRERLSVTGMSCILFPILLLSVKLYVFWQPSCLIQIVASCSCYFQCSMLLSLSENVPSELMKLHSATECSRLCKNQPLCQVIIDNVDEAWRLKIHWKMFTIIGNYLFSFMNWDLGISCLHLDDCVKLCRECKQTVWSLFRRGTSMSTLVAISSRSKLSEKKNNLKDP